MNNRAAQSLFLGILLASLPATFSLPTNDGGTSKDLESVYDVTTKLMDDVKESIFTIKLKCRSRTEDILACRLYDPEYQTRYHKTPCENPSLCNDEQHLTADSSYVGSFEIKYRSLSVERLTVSSGTSLKQLSFYRIMANHLFPGVDVTGKPEGTYSLIEESVYGKCDALVKIVRTRSKENAAEDKRVVGLVPNTRYNGNETLGNARTSRETLSIKRTRNLETCYPVPGLLIFDAFFYHPMMVSVHYDIKSSISRLIVSDRGFTSYTTEDIAVKSLERGGNTTMLHVRTTLTLQSFDHATDPIARIIDPVSVELPFVDGFDPANRNNNNSNKTLTPSKI